jgi:hypothetical protein
LVQLPLVAAAVPLLGLMIYVLRPFPVIDLAAIELMCELFASCHLVAGEFMRN